MSLIASKAGGGNSANTIEAGTYPAVCVSLIDIGVQYNPKWEKSASKLVIQWELIGETITVDGKEVNRTISKTLTNSLNEKSALFKLLISWRGRDFTEEEFAHFDLHNILGAPCMLTISNSERDGKTFANVETAGKMMKGMTVKPTLPLFSFDLDTDPLEKMRDIPKWIVDRIEASETYKERIAGGGNYGGEDYDGPPAFTDEDDP